MCVGGLASRTRELSSITAERNQYRSEAAEAGRQADKLTQRLSAMPKVCPFIPSARIHGALTCQVSGMNVREFDFEFPPLGHCSFRACHIKDFLNCHSPIECYSRKFQNHM